jgi:hypothetical protein
MNMKSKTIRRCLINLFCVLLLILAITSAYGALVAGDKGQGFRGKGRGSCSGKPGQSFRGKGRGSCSGKPGQSFRGKGRDHYSSKQLNSKSGKNFLGI